MSLFDTVVFALFAVVLIGSSVGAVLMREVWHAALLLGVALLSIAALYILLAAELLAAIQILVYVGGVMVLIAFAVMLTAPDDPDEVIGR